MEVAAAAVVIHTADSVVGLVAAAAASPLVHRIGPCPTGAVVCHRRRPGAISPLTLGVR